MAFSARRNSRRFSRSIVWIALLAGCSAPAPDADVAGVRTVLENQVEAWNNGDVEGYMTGYWRSDSTVFVSGGSRYSGYDSVLARYQRSYPTREAMGVLSFEELEIVSLSTDVSMARGIWRLRRESDEPWGRFTLVLERKAEGWRIVYDHTSSAD